MKHLIILAIALSSASLAFADRSSFRDRADNWLQHENTSTTSGLRNEGDAPTIGTENPTTTPTTPYDAPVGNALGLILSFGLVYGGGLFIKKQYSSSKNQME